MKKLLFILLGTIVIQFSQAQAPNDNIGSGNCLDFDGSGLVSINLNTNDLPSPITFLFWVKPTTPIAHQSILSGYRNGHLNRWEIVFGYPSSQVVTFLFGEPPIQTLTSASIPFNEWTHVAIVHDVSNANSVIYINGEIDGTSTIMTRELDTNVLFGFGGRTFTHGSRFYGGIDEVQIWDRVLTQMEIQDNMCKQLSGNEAGLVGYWNMNEGSGNTVNDLTSNNNHGTRQ